MKRTIIYILLFAAIGIVVYFVFALIAADKKDNTQVPAVQYKTDTLVKVEYVDRVEYRDNFVYKTVYRNVTPPSVKGEKIHDTTFIESVKYKDMILTLRKGRKNIEVFGWNEHDSLLKKYEFENVGTEFNVWADSGAIRVDEKWATWKGIDAVVRGSFLVSRTFLRDNTGPFITDRNYYAGLKTGLQLFNKVGVDGGAYYDYNNRDWKIEAELSYKLY